MLSSPGVPKTRPPFLSLLSCAVDQSWADTTPSMLRRFAPSISIASEQPLSLWSQSSNIQVEEL